MRDRQGRSIYFLVTVNKQVKVDQARAPADGAHPPEPSFDVQQEGKQFVRPKAGLHLGHGVEKPVLPGVAQRGGPVKRRHSLHPHAGGSLQHFQRPFDIGLLVAHVAAQPDICSPKHRGLRPASSRKNLRPAFLFPRPSRKTGRARVQKAFSRAPPLQPPESDPARRKLLPRPPTRSGGKGARKQLTAPAQRRRRNLRYAPDCPTLRPGAGPGKAPRQPQSVAPGRAPPAAPRGSRKIPCLQ
ncbi:hypothetical protein PTH_0206 [Pelotomaculum thermopropionicum SI]|uniref:Uncharacterized protein n=1 Tax=Pelotomaculum thermopropionicum (strain DSM 13744 / JCM 10971 / SI) TaxID=370438 RepID=A5D5V4_PELTS|nr:hypothetical protein PTH_0206 [Pelotomaculum thermopropionicum SI]